MNVILILIACLCYLSAFGFLLPTLERVVAFVRREGFQPYLRWVLFRDARTLIGLFLLCVLTGFLILRPPSFLLWILPVHALVVCLVVSEVAPPRVLILHSFDKRNSLTANRLSDSLRGERVVSLCSGNMKMNMAIGGVESISASHFAWMELVCRYCEWADVIVLNLSYARKGSAFVERELTHVLAQPALRGKAVLFCSDPEAGAVAIQRHAIPNEQVHWLHKTSLVPPIMDILCRLRDDESIRTDPRYQPNPFALPTGTVSGSVDGPVASMPEPVAKAGLDEAAYCEACQHADARSVFEANQWRCPQCNETVKPACDGVYESHFIQGAGCLGWGICMWLVTLAIWRFKYQGELWDWVALHEVCWWLATIVVVPVVHIMVPRALEYRHRENAFYAIAAMYFWVMVWVPWNKDFHLPLAEKVWGTVLIAALAMAHAVVVLLVYRLVTPNGRLQSAPATDASNTSNQGMAERKI